MSTSFSLFSEDLVAKFQVVSEEMRTAEEMSSPRSSTMVNVPLDSTMQKTAYCIHAFLGRCKFGYKCCFAHSSSELKVIAVPPNYKKTWCRNKDCKYGLKCHFLHKGEMIEQEGTNIYVKMRIQGYKNPIIIRKGIITTK